MLTINDYVLNNNEQYAMIIQGMRNPKNSWAKADSFGSDNANGDEFVFGSNDISLMKSLALGGPVHAKYRRMMAVYVDITAPLYWWKEFDTYKVGTVCNSCSTMHKIHSRPLRATDFSLDHIHDDETIRAFGYMVELMNQYRKKFVESKYTDKDSWYSLIQLLPTNYNQTRTIMLNYEVLANIYKWRRNHKLDEWHVFCDWIETLPLFEEIIKENDDDE